MDLGEDPSGKYSLLQGAPRDGYIIIQAIDKTTKKRYSGRFLMRKNLFHTSYFDSIQMEYEILGSVSHPYIQKLIETTYNSHVLAQIVESEELTLLDYYKFDFPLRESLSCNLFYRLVEAVYYLHSNSIVHLDIRPENVFIVDKQFKLGGFLASHFEGEDEIITGTYGTPNFQAPEIFTNPNFDGRKADVWACGIFLLAILTGSLPFGNFNVDSKENPYEQIAKEISTAENIIPLYLSDDVRDILQMMLNKDPLKRATIAQVRDHRWFNQVRVTFQTNPHQEIPPCSQFVPITHNSVPKPMFNKVERVLSTVVSLSTAIVYETIQNYFGEQNITQEPSGSYLIDVRGQQKSILQAEIYETEHNQTGLNLHLVSGSEFRFNEMFSQIVCELSNKI